MKKKAQKRGGSVLIVFFLIICLCNFAIAHGWKAPKKASEKKNPVKISETSIREGKAVYDQLCSYCHGDTAQGGKGLDLDIQTMPPDLKKRLKGHSEGDFFWKIITGRGDMPSFKENLEEDEIWKTITYINSLMK